ncbi:hypothetical protein [Pseudomonas putida]|uniref:hypothetical protein n=1 Tax=Pseudomonas putida TaxID=303 RepID=UPI000E0045F5|nr:hypothetical protein [Pseudomonas putida]SUD78519.1 Uncharacterised protein [Pseudomonas putida]
MSILRVIAVASMIFAPLVYAEDKPASTGCPAKIAQLESIERSEGAGQQSGVASDIRRLIKQAKEANAKGDEKGCMSAANRALKLYNTASE